MKTKRKMGQKWDLKRDVKIKGDMHNMKQRDIAKEIGCIPSQLSSFLNGYMRIGFHKYKDIEFNLKEWLDDREAFLRNTNLPLPQMENVLGEHSCIYCGEKIHWRFYPGSTSPVPLNETLMPLYKPGKGNNVEYVGSFYVHHHYTHPECEKKNAERNKKKFRNKVKQETL